MLAPLQKPAIANNDNVDVSSQNNRHHTTSAPAQSKSIKPTPRGQYYFLIYLYIYIPIYCTLLVHRKPLSHDDREEDDVINVDVSSQSNRYCNTSNDNHQSSSASSEHDENADDENELSEGDNDLSGLTSVSLQRKISSEVKSLVFLFIFVLDAKYFLI